MKDEDEGACVRKEGYNSLRSQSANPAQTHTSSITSEPLIMNSRSNVRKMIIVVIEVQGLIMVRHYIYIYFIRIEIQAIMNHF